MLLLKTQRRWLPWKAAGIELLLSPLTVSQRAELAKQATVRDADDKPVFNHTVFQNAVADACLHDWKGVMGETPDGKQAAQACTAEARHAFMEIGPANDFVFEAVGGLGLVMAKQVENAGNG